MVTLRHTYRLTDTLSNDIIDKLMNQIFAFIVFTKQLLNSIYYNYIHISMGKYEKLDNNKTNLTTKSKPKF